MEEDDDGLVGRRRKRFPDIPLIVLIVRWIIEWGMSQLIELLATLQQM